ncbi:MAG: gliding motility-associated C-terminal domain-containing protein [Chitinophagales bacterium]|nr:gliding motility-associated C-terminal domain-containing protein [Chitinophagales bacterium]
MNKYYTFFFPAFLLFLHIHPTRANGVDSIKTLITPVQCYGYRNGIIQVDQVFGGVPPYYYSLDNETYSTNPMFDRLWAGVYNVYVRDGNGVSNHWSIELKEPAALLVKLESSVPEVVAGEPFGLRAITSVEPEFLESIIWTPEELFSRHDTLRQWVDIAETTQFTIQVMDKNGCIDIDDRTVEVSSTPVYLPNVIKPGSTDEDGFFTLFAGEGVRQITSMQIYSRGGSLIFERQKFPANAPTMGWNGRWHDRYVQPGVYAYLVMVELADGKTKRFQGTVTVLN